MGFFQGGPVTEEGLQSTEGKWPRQPERYISIYDCELFKYADINVRDG